MTTATTQKTQQGHTLCPGCPSCPAHVVGHRMSKVWGRGGGQGRGLAILVLGMDTPPGLGPLHEYACGSWVENRNLERGGFTVISAVKVLRT